MQSKAVQPHASVHHKLTATADMRAGTSLLHAEKAGSEGIDLRVRLPNLCGLRYARRESAGVRAGPNNLQGETI